MKWILSQSLCKMSTFTKGIHCHNEAVQTVTWKFFWDVLSILGTTTRYRKLLEGLTTWDGHFPATSDFQHLNTKKWTNHNVKLVTISSTLGKWLSRPLTGKGFLRYIIRLPQVGVTSCKSPLKVRDLDSLVFPLWFAIEIHFRISTQHISKLYWAKCFKITGVVQNEGIRAWRPFERVKSGFGMLE